VANPLDTVEIDLGAAPLQNAQSAPPRAIQLKPTVSVRLVRRHFPGCGPEQLNKQSAAYEIGFQRRLEFGTPQGKTLLREHQDSLLFEVTLQFNPVEFQVVGHLGKKQRGRAAAAIRADT
jgi:hypothetical protein